MVARVRGKGAASSSARARTPAKAAPQRPAPKTRKVAPRASKFRAGGAGLSPRLAMTAAMGAVLVVAGAVLMTGDRPAALGRALSGGVGQAFAAVGFRVASVQVAGASPAAAVDIAAAAALGDGDPVFGADLAAIRDRVIQVGWVEQASVTRVLPDTIVIKVRERRPAAVWRVDGLLRVVDAEGRVIREADPARFAELPLIVGPGANEADGVIFELVRARPRLAERLEALVRVDGRRWDLRLKSGALVMLPATGEESALMRLDQLDTGQQVLDLGFERIDLRSPEMVVVRRADGALASATPGAA